MNGDKRNYSLSIWDHKDNFLCLLKPASGSIEGQSYNENLTQNIHGEETLSFTIPAYINEYKKNNKWDYIFNEQKVRYIEYDEISNKPKENGIKEFVLKHYEENRNGYEKTIQCECEPLAIYELSKVGWNINFDIDYITQYEIENNPNDYLTLDFWLRKIFYKETNLGRVSTTTECTYLLQGLQLRDNEGYPIKDNYSIDENGNYYFERIDEPICKEIPNNYLNTTGWYWEIQVIDPRRLDEKIITNIIYEEPTIDRYIESSPNNYLPYSYQRYKVGDNEYEEGLKPFPIQEKDYKTHQYITEIKKSLFSCERSNIFSVIQDLCETFKVWPYFIYNYNEQGCIISRKILFKSEAVNDNIIFDFSYGKNLQSCSRIIDSNELITKLIIPDTNSNLDSDRILSIKQATANPTGEGYIYNFDYYYNSGNLTRLTEEEKLGLTSITEHSDEYYINFHCGKIKNLNNNISNIQSYLIPLYDRQMTLDGELSVQQAAITSLKENIQSIQNQIDAIPKEQQIVSSWVSSTTQQNYIGELKTITTTTDASGNSIYYINFGRENVLYEKSISYEPYRINNEGELIIGINDEVEGFRPRYCGRDWRPGLPNNPIPTDIDFIELNDNIGFPVYSKIGNEDSNFIKGFYLYDNNGRSYIRIRYKYAPLAYYYLLIKDYWEKIDKVEEQIKILNKDLQEINNKIIANEAILNNLLLEKNTLILQFEKKYYPFIKEGYWEPSDYQAQETIETMITNNPRSIYEGIISEYTKLSDLNLNNSLHNYSYYIPLPNYASLINIETINMFTKNPIGNGDIVVPRYLGHDFEIYKLKQENKYILGISPELIDSYEKKEYDLSYYASAIEYNLISGEQIIISLDDYEHSKWINFNSENSPVIEENFIYLSDDNIRINTLSIKRNNIKLKLFTDYTYSYDYIGYDKNGKRKSLNEQNSYDNDIYYDYILKITLKKTPINNEGTFENNPYIITYSTETTLKYLYYDAVTMSKEYAFPKVTYNISILDISSLNDYKNYKPILGQKVPIFDPEMQLNGYEGFITSITKELEKPENTQIELATYETKFEDIFQKLTATMTDIRYNQNELMTAANSFTADGTIKTETFQNSLNNNNYKIRLGVNNDITIDKTNGITLIDQDNNGAVKLIGNGIFLTDNYSGNNSFWKTGITGEGINASALTVGNIDTKNINIWNSSEGQIRFIWNEQGLFSYGPQGINGTSTSTAQDFVDYNKFIKFNYDGLDFNDGGKSALSLGWDGLQINAQNNSLQLDAEQGLIIKDWKNGNAVTRLELGKLDDGLIYGLRLSDTTGQPSFQSDSDGNLWLSKYIKVGGQYDVQTGQYDFTPNAGIVGITTADDKYKMGLVRTTTGEPIWSNNVIRFWAGPQSKNEYLDQLGMTNDLAAENILNNHNIQDNDPVLARFKVDEQGNIIASGIDVGGWTGQGNILRSKDYEAILRSGNYKEENYDKYPVFAIGTSTELRDGTDYNLKIYQNGELRIGGDQFIATSTGAVTAKNLTITGGNININNNSEGENVAINVNNIFQVMKDGTVIANNISIGGSNSSFHGGEIAGWTLTENSFYREINGGYITALYPNRGTSVNSSKPVLYIGHKNHLTDNETNTKFKITENGSVYFHGNIYGWSESQNRFKPGLESGITSFYTGEGLPIKVEICQGLIVDMR